MKFGFLLLVILATTAQADILIYSGVSTGRVTGVRKDYKLVANGRHVLDWETGEHAAIGWFTLNGQKHYSVQWNLYASRTVVGAVGKRSTIIATADMGYDSLGNFHVRHSFGRGQNAVLTIRPGRRVEFPQVVQTTDKVLQDGPNGSVVVEAKGVSTFAVTGTQQANARAETLSQAVDRITAGLRAQGYTEIVVPE